MFNFPVYETFELNKIHLLKKRKKKRERETEDTG